MSAQSSSASNATTGEQPLDLSRVRNLPNWLMGIGGILALIGLIGFTEQFAFSWLLAYMFCLSIVLGSLCLVMLHHLFDASWSVPIRRVCEQIAGLAPVMAGLFIPILFLAGYLYGWMNVEDPHADHALHAKLPWFTTTGFYLTAILCLGVWWILARNLRYWSLQQDQTGSAECTYKMRFISYWGIFAFAATLTLAAIMWMKSLQHQWFSTMYGVYYFAASVWTTLGTVYIIVRLLQRQGPLREVIGYDQYYYLGSILLAFTVFYAYIHFAQYFIIWNGNMPEETFWYKVREQGTWWDIGMIIIFGHFFVPFLSLLRIDIKLSWFMIPMGIWIAVMHYFDLSFNIMPVLHPNGIWVHWLDLACLAFMLGLLARIFLKNFNEHAPYPQKDPRLAEALHIYMPPASGTVEGAAGEARAHGDAK